MYIVHYVYYLNNLLCFCLILNRGSCNLLGSITFISVFICFMSRYKIVSDPAGWLTVNKDTGVITVKNAMDRESHFVKDNKYTALIGAYDNGRWEARLLTVAYL